MIIRVNRPSPLHTNVKPSVDAIDYVTLNPGDNEIDDKVGRQILESRTCKRWFAEQPGDEKPWAEVIKAAAK